MTFFYNLNKKLDEIRATPSTTHGQLNERDMGKHNNATTGFDALAKKAAKEYGSKAAGERVAGAVKAKMAKAGKLEEQDMEEGIGDAIKKVGNVAKKVGGAVLNKLGHGDDAEMMRDLQKKMGATGAQVHGKKSMATPNEGVDKQAFAALAPPKDKITFADKIAGAKKEVDEMLGDVAAEAIKSALTPKQKKLDKNNNGKLDANDFAMLRKGGKQETDEGFPTVAGARAEMNKRKVGDVTHGAKHDTEETPTGRRVTRRTDPNTGYSVGADSDEPASGEKRGRGRPKKTDGPRQERKTANSRKADRTSHGQAGFKKAKAVDEGAGEGDDMVKLAKVIASCTTQAQLDTARRMAQNFLKKHQTGDLAFYGDDMKRGMAVSKDIAKKRDEIGGGQELDEKAVSKKQQKFMGMVHAAQKGEKPASKEVAKVAKEMPKKAAKDFASTKQKGLPEKAPKKKEKTEEAGGTNTPTASSGFSFGQGIYDSLNRELESMIAESMNISMNMNSDAAGGPSKSLTVTATDDDAMKLSDLLKNAGLGGDAGAVEVSMDADSGEDIADQIRQAVDGHEHGDACDACGQEDCGCEEVDEAYGDDVVSQNSPDYPTNTETSHDALQYSGGLNKPKTDVAGDGQTTIPNTAVHTQDEDALRRLREMAGIHEAAKPDFLDVDKDGDKEESFEKAVDDKKTAGDKKVAEGLMAELQRFKKA